MNSEMTIFTDGSSRGNPGPGGWGAVIVNDNNISELGGYESPTTNNRMELTACIEALSKTDFSKSIIINTDSSYVINGITKWVSGWKRNGWITKTKDEVLNKDLWERLLIVSQNKKINWNYVGGHSGIVGNERCDEIATGFADGVDVNLYEGVIDNYNIKNILDLSQAVKSVSKKNHSKATAYSYISMVNGIIEIHKTWTECEARVKGKSNTKYRKAISKEQELEIIEEFKNSK